jgi:hypothetical protein
VARTVGRRIRLGPDFVGHPRIHAACDLGAHLLLEVAGQCVAMGGKNCAVDVEARRASALRLGFFAILHALTSSSHRTRKGFP